MLLKAKKANPRQCQSGDVLQLPKKGPLYKQMHKAKKLALVLTTSIPVTDDAEEVMLKRVPYIHYLVQFQEEKVRVLFDSGSKVNSMSPTYVEKVGFQT